MEKNESETMEQRVPLSGRARAAADVLWSCTRALGMFSMLALVGACGLGYLERRQHRVHRGRDAELLAVRMHLADLHEPTPGTGECIRDSAGTCRNGEHYPRVHADNLHPGCWSGNTGRACDVREHFHPMAHGEDLNALAMVLPAEGDVDGLVLDARGAGPREDGCELARNAQAPGGAAEPDPLASGAAVGTVAKVEPGPES